MAINKKNMREIGDFVDSNLNFAITVLIWDLSNDFHLSKKKMKNLQNLSFCII